MSVERLSRVLVEPHVSEKSTVVADKCNQYVFKVLADATKAEIKQAVEHNFKVNVVSVQLCNLIGKRKRTQGIPGRRNNWKKAYVRIQSGQDIRFAGID